MKLGLDKIRENPSLLKNNGRICIVSNQAVTDSMFTCSANVIYNAVKETSGSIVSAVFGPQHGYYQTEQYNMVETPDGTFTFPDGYSVPLFSLYSETRIPTKEQLENCDTIVLDLIDVGCRIYTYMLTLAGCLQSAAQFKKKVIVLDRPNPLGLSKNIPGTNEWQRVEGNLLDLKWKSFVGWYEIPMRHGMSMGELGNLFIARDKLDVNYEVITVEGLTRATPLKTLSERPFTLPSPNLPSWLSVLFFPAFVFLEGTMVSEGRGSTLPFQIVGSPYFNVAGWLQLFNELKKGKLKTAFSSIVAREHHFRPTFNTHVGEICKGVQFHVTSPPETFHAFSLGIYFLAYMCSHKEFSWRSPGYEYNDIDPPICLILGSEKWKNLFDKIHKAESVDKHFAEINELLDKAHLESQKFAENTRQFHLYA